MTERLDFARVSTQVRVVVGSDGSMLHPVMVTPYFRKLDEKAITNVMESDYPKEIKVILKEPGTKIIWLSSDQKDLLGVECD